MSFRSSKTGTSAGTNQRTSRTRKQSSGAGAFDQEKQQYYSFLGISNPFPPRTREQQSKSDGPLAVTLPPLTSCRKTSSHCHTEKRRVSASTGPPEGVLRKASKETKKMLQELDKNLIESEPVEQTITDLPERTPEPEILHDFPELRSGSVSKPERIRRHSSYEPRYCWCTRCQIMYRLYKDNDHSLEGWGKYPCFHL
ncbi:uncharacterized protein LOC111122424 isoform X2 [Crassostrea virginica]|uniref:Uncharacterized protein LOC111122424 n=1 Tax=Crassostrea virginica TaxID=6565 RepID=A0A8B8CXG0_CRAVI|nr:uncharacterized protein LOC111122424 [Crassostrea virginica]